MKRLFSTCLLVFLALTRSASSQPSLGYTNLGNVLAPLNIDAYNFVNAGTVDLTGYGLLFSFSDTTNFVNRGTMTSDIGFVFDTEPTSGSAGVHAAASFNNASTGTIKGSSPVLKATGVVGLSLQGPQVRVTANAITNAGDIHVGIGGLIRLAGNNLNLKNGTLEVDGVSASSSATNIIFTGISGLLTSIPGLFPGVYPSGVYDTYWGVGTDTNTQISFQYPLFATSGVYDQTNSGSSFALLQSQLSLNNLTAYGYTAAINGDTSNLVTQIVVLGDNNLDGNISMSARFEAGFLGSKPSEFPIPVVQWLSVVKNLPGLPPVTNTLYLTDDFGVRTNGFNIVKTNSSSLSGQIGYSPTNYTFSRVFSGFTNLSTGNFPGVASILTNGLVAGTTNDYTAYGVTLLATTASPDPTHPLQNITNTPGRIEIVGANADLTKVRITGPNYLSLTITNHFTNGGNAQISAPTEDLNLATTNGILLVTNLVAPYLPQFSGTIDMYSTRWTNIFAGSSNANGTITPGFTNRYHMLMLQSQLSSLSVAAVQNFALRTTNTASAGASPGSAYNGTVYISDLLNITSNLQVVADQVIITTNRAGSATPEGQINLSSDFNWSGNFPTLKSLSNYGQITLPGFGQFFQDRMPPYYASASTVGYASLANYGVLSSGGVSIWATNFVNAGTNAPGTLVTLINTNFFFLTNSILFNFNTFSYSIGQGLISASAGPVILSTDNGLLMNGEIAAPMSDVSITAGNLTMSNHGILAGGALNLAITTNNYTVDGSGRFLTNTWQVGNGFTMTTKPVSGDFLGTTLTSILPPRVEAVSTWAGINYGDSPAGFTNNGALGHLILDGGDIDSTFTFTAANGTNNALYVDLLELRNYATNRLNPDLTELNIDPNFTIYFADARILNNDGTTADISEKLNHANGERLRWVPGFAGLFSGTNVTYPSGVTYTLNRPLVQSTALDSNGNGIPNAYDPAPVFVSSQLVVGMRLTNKPTAGSVVLSWPTIAGGTNHVDLLTNFSNGNWSSVTNFVSPTGGNVSVTLPSAGKAGFYRVRIDPQQP